MNKKLIHALNTILNIAKEQTCKQLHHKESQYHDSNPHTHCPAEYELGKICHIVEEHIKELKQ